MLRIRCGTVSDGGGGQRGARGLSPRDVRAACANPVSSRVSCRSGLIGGQDKHCCWQPLVTWRVGASDVVWLHAVSADLGDLRAHEETTAAALGALSDRLGSPVSTYTELTPHGPLVHFDGASLPSIVDDLNARLTEHPLFPPMMTQSVLHPGVPVRLSEVLSVHDWREHPIYREILAPQQVPVHSVCLPVSTSAGGRLRFYQFNRDDKDFSDSEVGLLARLQLVLVALTGATPARCAAPRPASSPPGRPRRCRTSPQV